MKTDKIENIVVICARLCSSVVTIKRNDNETILQLIDEVENCLLYTSDAADE